MKLRSIIHFIETRPLLKIKLGYGIYSPGDEVSEIRKHFLSTFNILEDLPTMGFINRTLTIAILEDGTKYET